MHKRNSVLSVFTTLIEGFYNSSLNTMVSDTMIIYLRNVISPFAKIDSAKSVLDNSGMGSFIFFNAINSANYYIAMKHRNSIETWSAEPKVFTNSMMTYNFSTAQTQAYGSNMILKGIKMLYLQR
ncbi:MAG: hypothetical protein M3R36_04825 [Bacteroidota bacterium]|nr:hypothetical protein [Bacteroidota bacterium]